MISALDALYEKGMAQKEPDEDRFTFRIPLKDNSNLCVMVRDAPAQGPLEMLMTFGMGLLEGRPYGSVQQRQVDIVRQPQKGQSWFMASYGYWTHALPWLTPGWMPAQSGFRPAPEEDPMYSLLLQEPLPQKALELLHANL